MRSATPRPKTTLARASRILRVSAAAEALLIREAGTKVRRSAATRRSNQRSWDAPETFVDVRDATIKEVSTPPRGGDATRA